MPHRKSRHEIAVLAGSTAISVTLQIEPVEIKGESPPLIEIPIKVGVLVFAPHWNHLSALGRSIVRLLADRGESMTCEEISHILDESPTGKCKYILGDLAERGILKSGKDGTRLNPPPGVDYNDFRRSVLGWLDGGM